MVPENLAWDLHYVVAPESPARPFILYSVTPHLIIVVNQKVPSPDFGGGIAFGRVNKQFYIDMMADFLNFIASCGIVTWLEVRLL